MNYAASQAQGEILYFVHADTLPPASYLANIDFYVQQGYTSGCYQSLFENDFCPEIPGQSLSMGKYCQRHCILDVPPRFLAPNPTENVQKNGVLPSLS